MVNTMFAQLAMLMQCEKSNCSNARIQPTVAALLKSRASPPIPDGMSST